MAVLAPLLAKSDYLRSLLFLVCVYAILTLSADIIFGWMGQCSFGHQAFFGIGAYTSAKLCLNLGITPLLAFLGAFILAGLSGLIIGYICLRRLREMYLAITTFGLGSIFFLFARNWYDFTGGLSGLGGIPSPQFLGFLIDSEIEYYYLALIFLVFTIYFLSRLWSSRPGRAMIGLRENESLARSVGIIPTFHYTLGFSIACGFAGLSGALYVHEMGVVNPLLFEFDYMIIILMAMIVGGMGTLGGPILGAAIYVFLSEFLRITGEFRYLLLGLILLLAIIFMSDGIFPWIKINYKIISKKNIGFREP